jgi:GDP-L-fucose synthase
LELQRLRDGSIFVAGHLGMAGSAIVRRLKAAGCKNLILRTRTELDLTDSASAGRQSEVLRP